MVTVVELVRHAKAQRRDRWWGRPDRERPLTEEGGRQARALAHDLTDADALGEPATISVLWSSPWDRCTQTLLPLSDALGLPVQVDDRLGEVAQLPVHDGGDAWVTAAWMGGRAAQLIDRAVHEHPGTRIVACSHGDVIPAVMALLAGRDGLPLTDVRCQKTGRYTLTFNTTSPTAVCTTAEYHPPPS